MLELIFLAIVGVVLLYLYMHEKDEIFKIAWLLSGLIIIFIGSYININLNTIISSSPTYSVLTNTSIANVPLVCSSALQSYSIKTLYLNKSLSDFGYNSLSNYSPSTIQKNITLNSGLANGKFLIAKYITASNQLNFTHISLGNRELTIYASSNGSVKLSGQVWILSNTGNFLYALGSTGESTTLTPNVTPYTLRFYVNQTFNVSGNHRKAVLIFENVSAFGLPFNTTIYSGIGNESHFALSVLKNNVSDSINCGTTTEISNTITAYKAHNTTENYKYGNSSSLNTFGIAFSGILILVGGIIGYRILEKLLKHFFK